jgi:hypothetical protein
MRSLVIGRDSPTQLYFHLVSRSKIRTVAYRMSSVKTLRQEHCVSHITAEKALSVLKKEALF